jgi:hypothetical protein
VPSFNKDKRCLKDSSLPVYEASYLLEINKNKRSSEAVFLRQYFPLMAIFTLAVYRRLIYGRKRELNDRAGQWLVP